MNKKKKKTLPPSPKGFIPPSLTHSEPPNPLKRFLLLLSFEGRRQTGLLGSKLNGGEIIAGLFATITAARRRRRGARVLSFSSFFSLFSPASFLCRRRGKLPRAGKLTGEALERRRRRWSGDNGCQKLSKLSLAVELSEETVGPRRSFGVCACAWVWKYFSQHKRTCWFLSGHEKNQNKKDKTLVTGLSSAAQWSVCVRAPLCVRVCAAHLQVRWGRHRVIASPQ